MASSDSIGYVNRSSSSSELPDWIASYKSPVSRLPPGTPSSDELNVESPEHVDERLVTEVDGKEEDEEVKIEEDAPPTEPLEAQSRAAVAQGDKSEMQVMMPDKIPHHKVLVELNLKDAAAGDLSGDAGAVGRLMLVGKSGQHQELRVDLKGTVYTAEVVPLAGTMMVVNLGQQDAKVEAVLSQFLRLQEESSFSELENLLEGSAADLLGDDEDNYLLDDGADKKTNEREEQQEGATKKARAKQRHPATTQGRGHNPKSLGGQAKAKKSLKGEGKRKVGPTALKKKGPAKKKPATASAEPGRGGAGGGKVKGSAAKKRKRINSDDDHGDDDEDDSDYA